MTFVKEQVRFNDGVWRGESKKVDLIEIPQAHEEKWLENDNHANFM